MITKFIELKDRDSNRPIHINPALIVYYKGTHTIEAENKLPVLTGSIIRFSLDDYVLVHEFPGVIYNKIGIVNNEKLDQLGNSLKALED